MSDKTYVSNCPFCGCKVKITRGLISAPFWFFKCQNPECGAIMSFDNLYSNAYPPAALTYFNKRYKGGESNAKE